MADKQINELPGVPAVTADTLIPVYVPGSATPAQRMTGAQFRSFGVDAVQEQVTNAENAAKRAENAKDTAVAAAADIGIAVDEASASAAAAEASRQAIENMIVEAITLATGQSATVSKSLVDGVVKLVFGLPAGEKGNTGDPGSSIQSIDRTSGTGAPGTTDTYTITLTNGNTTTFNVYNGKDGTGAGDMTAIVYDPQGKAQDVFAYADGAAAAAEEAAKSYTNQQIAAIPKSEIFSVSLLVSGWSGNAQTVNHTMLKATGYGYIYNPDDASYGAYVSAMVRCGDVTVDGQVTFYCDETPTDDITVDFLRIEANENV